MWSGGSWELLGQEPDKEPRKPSGPVSPTPCLSDVCSAPMLLVAPSSLPPGAHPSHGYPTLSKSQAEVRIVTTDSHGWWARQRALSAFPWAARTAVLPCALRDWQAKRT